MFMMTYLLGKKITLMSPQHTLCGRYCSGKTIGSVVLCIDYTDCPVMSSYTGSSYTCMVSSALFDSCKAALIFALLLPKIIAITIMKTIILTIRAVAREPIDIVYNAVLVPKLSIPTVSVVLEL